MSSFTEPLTVTQLFNGKWRTEREFTYFVGEENSGEFITVPKGFETDFYSIPIGFRWILPKSQKGNQASVLHDYLYSKRGKISPNQVYTRKQCDKIFLEAMKVLKINWLKRGTMYNAVRVGGWVPWGKSE